MSSFQTSLADIRQRTQGNPWLPWVAGVVIGLLLGLMIGWVLWPVEWKNAYLSDLSPEAKAEYLSAVADSYVVYGSDAARQQASQRLVSLQGNLMTELQSAMEYYRARPSQENEIHIYNLAQLANALGAQANPAAAQVQVAATSEVPVVATSTDGIAQVVIPAPADANAAGNALNQSASGPSWFSRLLAFLAGILLIGGGLYVIQRLRATNGGPWASNLRQRVVGERSDAIDDYSFDEESESPTTSASTVSSTRVAPWSNQDEATNPRTSAPTKRVPWLEPTVDPDFDNEAEDEVVQRPSSAPATSTRPDMQFGDYNTEDEDFDDEPNDEDFAENETPQRTGGNAITPYRTPSPITPTTNRQSYAAESDAEDDDDLHDDDDQSNGEEELPTRSAQPPARHRGWGENSQPRLEPVSPPVRTGSAPAARYPGAKAIESFECTYYTGMGEYDESFPITDPTSKRYIGECGMGVSIKNRILHKNPDEVIALEVWLFDKADGNSLNNQMRILMSEYASDRYADVFHKERNGEARPFVPQPGLTFQLECPSLMLKGEVLEAEYSREGIFQKVKVRMDILRR
ncbi:MAG: hypothetical protein U0175_01065 [Caldilineaceae bacterium]